MDSDYPSGFIDYNKQTTTYATGATGEVNTGISDALQYC
jgi:hypothetical protein